VRKFFKIAITLWILFVVLIGCFSMLIRYDDKLEKKRGYGFVLLRRGGDPWVGVSPVLDRLFEFCNAHGGALTPAQQVPEIVPGLVLDANQPYRSYGIYILRTLETDQWFLYSSNISSNSFTEKDFEDRGISTKDALVLPVCMCVMATREVSRGQYRAYHEYPPSLAREIGEQAWRTWFFLSPAPPEVGRIESTIPPVPGCVALDCIVREEKSKFYYPEEILPQLRTIYPNVQVPEELILRKGADHTDEQDRQP